MVVVVVLGVELGRLAYLSCCVIKVGVESMGWMGVMVRIRGGRGQWFGNVGVPWGKLMLGDVSFGSDESWK